MLQKTLAGEFGVVFDTATMTETLICIGARQVDSMKFTEGFTSTGSDEFRRQFSEVPLWLGPRDSLETDEGFRQLVSYVVFRHQDSVLTYRRTPKGGETRLHGRLSIGVGGHVNVSDVVSSNGNIDIFATLQRACEREIAEEISCGPIAKLTTIGVICESVTAVSRVHLGVVVECWLNHPQVKLLDPGLVDGTFASISRLHELADQMETWSSALVPHFTRSV